MNGRSSATLSLRRPRSRDAGLPLGISPRKLLGGDQIVALQRHVHPVRNEPNEPFPQLRQCCLAQKERGDLEMCSVTEMQRILDKNLGEIRCE